MSFPKCSHEPPHPLDMRPCSACVQCGARAGMWCAMRCPNKRERCADEQVWAVGPEKWSDLYGTPLPWEESGR